MNWLLDAFLVSGGIISAFVYLIYKTLVKKDGNSCCKKECGDKDQKIHIRIPYQD